MSDYKQFTGKNVDKAIDAACKHFGVAREKLEVQIISGGSSGIFGLMGRKDAKVEARLRGSFGSSRPSPTASSIREELLADLKPQKAPKPRKEKKEAPKKEQPKAQEPKAAKPAPAPAKEEAPKPTPEHKAETDEAPKAEAKPKERSEKRRERKPRRKDASSKGNGQRQKRSGDRQPKEGRKPRRRGERPAGNKPQRGGRPNRRERTPRQEAPQAPPRELTPEETEALNTEVLKVLGKLIEPIIGETELTITNEPGRVKVRIEDDDNSGLIIGREGQTIAALQYIANRIIARTMETSVRVHLDAGSYRDRQDENLQNLALYLADKAKEQGRIQSTKPLSSYHRRLVHLALQQDEDISTRSKGEGPLKRVLIYPKRDKAQESN